MSVRLAEEVATVDQSTNLLDTLRQIIVSQEAAVSRGWERILELERRISLANAFRTVDEVPQGTSEQRYNHFRTLQICSNVAPERVFAVNVSGIIENRI